MTVRARAAVGVAEGGEGDGVHWSERTGRERLSEALGRLELDSEEERAALEAALLPLRYR